MILKFLLLTITSTLAIDFENPKLINGRLLVQRTDFGAMISKSKQCLHTQWNFTVNDAGRQTEFETMTKEFCDKIPMIEEFRKEIESERYRNAKVYDYSEETHKLTCNLDANRVTSQAFRNEIEALFFYNRISFAHIAGNPVSKVLLTASGLGTEWDMSNTFVQKAMRARPLYCDDQGVMLEICVPMAHGKTYGDVDQIIDTGSFNPSYTEFVYTNLPRMAIHNRLDGNYIGFEEASCTTPFDLGMTCDVESAQACNATTYADCKAETLAVDEPDFVFVREFGQFYVVATTDKDIKVTNGAGDVQVFPTPGNVFLVAIAEHDTVAVGARVMNAVKGTHFSRSHFINVNDLAEKQHHAQQKKKNILQKMFSFLGKK